MEAGPKPGDEAINAEEIMNTSFDDAAYDATDQAPDDGINVDNDDPEDEEDEEEGAVEKEKPKKPPFRDPPPDQVRLRPSSFRNIPATVFIEYPPELKIKREDPSCLEDLGKRQLVYQSYWERICIRNAFHRAGFVKLQKGPWTAMWSKHQSETQMQGLNCLQKVNHFPSSWCIGRKDRLVRTIQAMYRVHGNEYNFHPASFILPSEREAAHRQIAMDTKAAAQRNSRSQIALNGGMWIIKPCASSCGKGIQVVSGAQVTSMPKSRKVLVQKYIPDPYLIDNKKFDLRLYVMVTGVDPLRVYIFSEGLARFSTRDYNIKNLGDRFSHLTNYSINKKSKDFKAATEGGGDDEETEGFKWSLPAFKRWLAKKEGPEKMRVTMERIDDLLVKTMISAESTITPQLHSVANYRTNCFELFGCDVMLDSKLTPHLIEVNISPSLAGSSPLDKRIKGTLIADIMHVVGIYPHDPKLLKKFDAASAPSAVRLNKKTKSSAKVSARPSSAGYAKPASTADNVVNPFAFGSMSKMMASQDAWRKSPQPAKINFGGLGDNDAVWLMLLMAEDEFDRCMSTKFTCAHPTPSSAAHYNKLYFSARFSDQLLAQWVIEGGSRGALRRFIPEKYFSDKMKSEEEEKAMAARAVRLAAQQRSNLHLRTDSGLRSPGRGVMSPPRRSNRQGNERSSRMLVQSQVHQDLQRQKREQEAYAPPAAGGPQVSSSSSEKESPSAQDSLASTQDAQQSLSSTPPSNDQLDSVGPGDEGGVENNLHVDSRDSLSEAMNQSPEAAGLIEAAKRAVFASFEFQSPKRAYATGSDRPGPDNGYSYGCSDGSDDLIDEVFEKIHHSSERPMAASGSQRSGLNLMTKDEALDVVKNGLLQRSTHRKSQVSQNRMQLSTMIVNEPHDQQRLISPSENRKGSHVMTVLAQRQMAQHRADQQGQHKTEKSSKQYRSRSHGAIREAGMRLRKADKERDIASKALAVRDASTSGLVALPRAPEQTVRVKHDSQGKAPMRM